MSGARVGPPAPFDLTDDHGPSQHPDETSGETLKTAQLTCPQILISNRPTETMTDNEMIIVVLSH